MPRLPLRALPLRALPLRALPLRALALVLVLASAVPATAQDTKRLADSIIDAVLEHHYDGDTGLYGGDERLTCQVLSALTRSPRRYSELDGPFIRRPTALVAAAAGRNDALTAARALALAGMVTRASTSGRDEALIQLSQRPPESLGYEELLALRSAETLGYHFPQLTWPEPHALMPPEVAVLVVESPETVTPPLVSDVQGWTRWARAARLRGVPPVVLPPLSAPARDVGLPTLLAALETVVACHGIDLPSAPGGAPSEPVALPAKAPPGRSLETSLRAALAFLEDHQVEGTFGLELGPGHDPEPGITALNLTAAMRLCDRLGLSRPPWVDPGLDWLASLQREDGAILQYGLAVYTTSVAGEALLVGGRPEHAPIVAAARDYLLVAQADEGEGYSSEDDPHYGGIGYGGDERPDMSNTNMGLDALARMGTSEDDPVWDKALVFLQRNQNDAETNPETWERRGGGVLVAGTDGGATYMPGNSPAGEDEVGDGVYRARSYGSMTYALTKSYLLCGLPLDDTRVQAAVMWLADHFSVEVNPGFSSPEKGGDGLYYYYLAMARTLSLIPDDDFRTREGELIAWRERLQRHLIDGQRVDGSWINELSPRWWEGAPTLATAYAALALCESVPAGV